mgnify:FL=1
MKQWIIQIILIILLIASIGLGLNQYIKDKNTIDRLTNNIEQLEVDNSTLKFTTNELKSYVKDKDTKHKAEVDSILRLLKIKPKNLIRYERILVSNLDSNTTVASLEQPIFKNDSVSRVDWESVRKCLKIKGYVESLDPNPKVVITNTESSNIVYIVKSYKKSFWDVVFFRKGKEIIETTNECGESDINEIEIIK